MGNASDVADASHRRVVELDALRGVAALSVALYHFTTEYGQRYGHSAPLWVTVPIGKYGVQLFFAISGFVILMSLERVERVQDFVMARVARLYPSYWAAIALTFSVVTLLGLPEREYGIETALLNLTMFHELARVPHIDTVYWTLTIELSFYLLMLVLLGARVLDKIIPLFIALVALQMGLELVLQALGMPFASRFAGRPHLQFFALGVLAFKQSRGSVSVPSALVLSALCLVHEVLLESESPWPVLVAVLGITSALARGRLAWLTWRPLLRMGFISYPFYLVHQNIGYVVIRRLEAAGWRPEAAVAGAIGVGLVLATAITHLVEQPALRLHRRWRHKARTQVSVLPHVA